MTVKFGPLGASQILSVSGTSARAAIGTLPTTNPAIALVCMTALNDVHYVRLGDSTVTVDYTNGQRINMGTPDDITIVPVSNSETHVAIVSEGGSGDVIITPGSYCSDSAIFTPVGAAQILAVTNSDQRFALPTLGSTVPCFGLVAMQGLMGPLWIKLGDGTVTGSMTTSMRVMAGSADEPTVIRVTNSEADVSIFCEGAPGDLMLVPGNLLTDTSQTDGRYVLKSGDTMTGLLTIQRDVSGNSSALVASSADAGSNFGPQIKLARGSASPAAADLIGRVVFQGKDSGGNDTLYAYLQARIDDATDGSEDATLLLGRLIAGVDTSMPIMAPPSPAQGDIAYFDGAQWVRLAAGTSGQFLKTNGAGGNPAWANPLIWTTVKKTADQSRTSTTTLANDADLQFAMVANTKYIIKMRIAATASAVPGFKYALTGPASPTLVKAKRAHWDSTPAYSSFLDTAYVGSTSLTNLINGFFEFDMVVQNGANAGTFAFQWAQNTSSVTSISVNAGSYLEYATS